MVPATDLRRDEPHLLKPRSDGLHRAPMGGRQLLEGHPGFEFPPQRGELGIAPGSAHILRKVRAPRGAPRGNIERLDTGEQGAKYGIPLHDGIRRQRSARIRIEALHQGREDFPDTPRFHD